MMPPTASEEVVPLPNVLPEVSATTLRVAVRLAASSATTSTPLPPVALTAALVRDALAPPSTSL